MNIEDHIESLLFRYDCVIIPGFGGFVINPKRAEVRNGTDEFYPPTREITFNQNLTRNDGLLCDAVSAAEKVSYETAVRQVEEFNKENRRRLAEGLDVDIRGIGTFKNDVNGILQFEPNREANFLRASFGLSSFRSPAIKRDSVERVLEKKILKVLPKEAPAATASVAKERVNIVKYWPAAAVILVLIVASSVLVKTDVLNNISVNYSNINPFDSSAENIYDPRTNDQTVEESSLKNDEIDLWLESLPKKPAVKVKKTGNSKVVKRFHVIGGCFGIVANVKKMMRRLKRKGFEPTLAGKNRKGLQRVAFGSYATRAEAKEVLKYIKSTQMDSAWLYVSK